MQIILTAFAAGIAGLVTYGFTLLNAWIKSKIKNEKIRALLDVTLEVTESVVLSVQQTFVDQLKKDGKFDSAAQKEAFNMAFERAKAMISEEARVTLESLYGDFNTWLTVQIEALVQSMFVH